MIDNFDLIKTFLKFESEDDFYFLQLIRRKKENEDLGRNNEVVQTYYIRSQEQLDYLKPYIVHLCTYYNARAYINLNVRSFKKITCQCVREFAQRVCDNNYHAPHTIFNTVCGKMGATRNNTWIIDIDSKDVEYAAQIINFINNECMPQDNHKCIGAIPTKNGVHILTKPFNVVTFNDRFEDIIVHKNNPTILFVN